MCDCAVHVTPERVLFAKNSDRDANEAQLLDWQQARRHGEGARLRVTAQTLPQVRETFAVLLSRPFWMWGAEMGANEAGVVIGNEAVFTRSKPEPDGLLGMDLVRLGLERGETAAMAVGVITSLLERHGQGGRCGLEDAGFSYDNSFLVADASGAFVLETAGRRWQVERVEAGVRSISNALSITDFARAHDSWLETFVGQAKRRRTRTAALLRDAQGPADCAAALRDHGDGREAPRYGWATGALGAPCVHGGGVLAASQTVSSWISELRTDGARHWATGTSAPCTSLFKPVSVHQPVALPGHAWDFADGRSLWWRHERLHRRVMRDPKRLLPLYANERGALEARWFAEPPTSMVAFAEADAALERWLDRAQAVKVRDTRPLVARRYWQERTRDAHLTL